MFPFHLCPLSSAYSTLIKGGATTSGSTLDSDFSADQTASQLSRGPDLDGEDEDEDDDDVFKHDKDNSDGEASDAFKVSDDEDDGKGINI